MCTYIIICDDRKKKMSGYAEEMIVDQEEVTVPRSPSPDPGSPDVPRHLLDRSMEENDSGEGSRNILSPVQNDASAVVTTEVLSGTTPINNFLNLSRGSPSRLSQPLPQGLQVPTYPASNRPEPRHPRLTDHEISVQHRWLSRNLYKIPKVVEQLRNRTNILRREVESQDTQRVALESELEEAKFRIHGLEETVLELQEKIAQFETMFEAISRAAAITPPSPSQ